MKKLLLVSACALIVSATSVVAQTGGKRDRTTTGQAQSYAYCLKDSAGPGDCKYTSFKQCEAARSGTDAECVKNFGPH